MSDILPMTEPDDLGDDGYRRPPVWALVLAIALIATCVSVFSTYKVYANQSSYRADVYKNCLVNQRGRAGFTAILKLLETADSSVVQKVAAAHLPLTPFDQIELVGTKVRAFAYGLILNSFEKEKLGCANLKP